MMLSLLMRAGVAVNEYVMWVVIGRKEGATIRQAFGGDGWKFAVAMFVTREASLDHVGPPGESRPSLRRTISMRGWVK